MAKTVASRRTASARSTRRTPSDTESSQRKAGVASANKTDTTQRHGLAGPNARLRPGRATGQTFGVTSRTQSVGRPGATSDIERARNERRLPAANPTPRAAATSRSGSRRTVSKADQKRQESAQILVMATQMGYYDDLRRRPGDVFYIHAEEDFSDMWMEDAPAGAEPSITLGQDDIDRQHDEILADRAGSRARKTPTRRAPGGIAGNVNTDREARTLSEAQRRQQGIQRGRDDVNQEEIAPGMDNPLGAED